MNIVILSNHDIASAYALEQLVTGLSGHKLQVFLSARVGKNDPHAAAALRSLSAFEKSLLEEKDRYGLRSSCSFEAIEKKLGRPITLLSSVKTEEGLSALRKARADVFISIRFGLILHSEAIRLAPLGVINLHSGILPAYKGVMATFWAMKNHEKNIGTTLHFIQDSKIDSGDIVSISERPVDYRRSYLWNVLQLYPQGCSDIICAIEKLAAGIPIEKEAQPRGGQYYSFPRATDINAFEAQGNTLFKQDEDVSLLQ